jgi:hypothetical protein
MWAKYVKMGWMKSLTQPDFDPFGTVALASRCVTLGRAPAIPVYTAYLTI